MKKFALLAAALICFVGCTQSDTGDMGATDTTTTDTTGTGTPATTQSGTDSASITNVPSTSADTNITGSSSPSADTNNLSGQGTLPQSQSSQSGASTPPPLSQPDQQNQPQSTPPTP